MKRPFRLLWDYCERTGYDFYVVRDILFERIDRKLVCECEMLRDDEKRRRMELERIFGVDFGDPARRVWSWFSLLFGLLYWSGCRCGLRLLITNRILGFYGIDL